MSTTTQNILDFELRLKNSIYMCVVKGNFKKNWVILRKVPENWGGGGRVQEKEEKI